MISPSLAYKLKASEGDSYHLSSKKKQEEREKRERKIERDSIEKVVLN